VVFLTRVRSPKAVAGDDAAAAEWVTDWKKEALAFDHALVLRDAMRLLKKST
jgi:hypothetical protein